MKIAHISDLHICSKFKNDNLSKVKKLIKQIADSDADHLVITGDISDNSREEDFLWLRKTLKENDLLHSDKTSIIIGNHDIFGGVQTASEIIGFPLKCTRIDFKDKLRKFINHFEELFQNIYSPSSTSVFPYVKVVDNVSIIGINSVDKYSRIRNPFASNGYVSKEQIKQIQKIFDLENLIDKIKVVMIHHHFYKNNVSSKSSEHSLWSRLENFTMKLRRKKRLLRLFRQNKIGLVLHGHSHEIKEYHRQGIKFLNAGATVDNDNNMLSGYFMIDIFDNQIKTTFEMISQESLIINKHQLKTTYIPQMAN